MLIPKLRYWRERRALTQEELAEKANVGVRSVAGYEAGAGARPGNVRKLAEALDIDVSALMTEEEAPKAKAPHSLAEAAPEERRISARNALAERRLISALDPFATRIEGQTEFWRELAGSGQVKVETLEYAATELDLTARSFEKLVNAAKAERWSSAELGLLGHVYRSVTGPYRQAWGELMEAWATKSATDTPNTQVVRGLRLVAEESMNKVEKAGEGLGMAA